MAYSHGNLRDVRSADVELFSANSLDITNISSIIGLLVRGNQICNFRTTVYSKVESPMWAMSIVFDPPT